MGNERRQHYRVSSTTDRDVSVRIRLPNGSEQTVGLIDVSAGGVALALGVTEALNVRLNTPVTIIFDSNRLTHDLEITSHLRHIKNSDDNKNVIYGVSFDTWDKHRLSLTPKLKSLFNEREAVRVGPRDNEELEVHLVFEGQSKTMVGLLRDISVFGLGVWVNAEDTQRLQNTTNLIVEITLASPKDGPKMDLAVEIRHIAAVGERERVGLRFIETDRIKQKSRQKTITTYVMTRQIEDARIDAERRRLMEAHYPMG